MERIFFWKQHFWRPLFSGLLSWVLGGFDSVRSIIDLFLTVSKAPASLVLRFSVPESFNFVASLISSPDWTVRYNGIGSSVVELIYFTFDCGQNLAQWECVGVFCRSDWYFYIYVLACWDLVLALVISSDPKIWGSIRVSCGFFSKYSAHGSSLSFNACDL